MYRCIAQNPIQPELLALCVNSSGNSCMKVWNAQGTVEEKYVIHVSSQSTNEKKLNKTKVACKSQYLLLSPLVAINSSNSQWGRSAYFEECPSLAPQIHHMSLFRCGTGLLFNAVHPLFHWPTTTLIRMVWHRLHCIV